jgi:beta-galactosidase
MGKLGEILFNEKLYESTKRIGTENFRSYFVPFSKDDEFSFDCGIIARENSSLFTSLSGEWLIKAFSSIKELDSVDESLPDKVTVPSCLQILGYDQNQYVNFRYPYPFRPPYIDKDIPTFHYRKEFKLKEFDKLFLCFDGVDSAFYVYINGKFVGYSQISHSLSEFDITNFVRKGNNTLMLSS